MMVGNIRVAGRGHAWSDAARRLIRGVVHVVSVAALAEFLMPGMIGTPAQANDSIELSVSLFTPPSSDLNKRFRTIEAALGAETGGRITFKMFEASQMGPAPRQFDMVRTGVADMSVALLGLTPGRFPLLETLDLAEVVPPGVGEDIVSPVSAAALDLREKYLTDELAGVKLLNITLLPDPIIITTKEITDLAQIKNLRIRHPGPVHAATLEAIGAVPTFVQSTEMSEALARGTIDGALTGYTGVRSFKLMDSAKHVLELASGGMTFAVVMNEDAYNRIPADLRPAFDQYFGKAGQAAWGRVLAHGERVAHDQLVADGLQVTALSPDDKAAFAQISQRLKTAAGQALDAKGQPGTAFLSDLEAASAAYR